MTEFSASKRSTAVVPFARDAVWGVLTDAHQVARLTPMVRSFGSYVMGAAGIPPATFLLGTLIGSLAYCGVFLTLGSVLGANYRKPLEYLDAFGPRGLAIVAVAVVALIALHHVAGRFSLHRMARHFHLHHAQHAPATTRVSRG